MLDDTEKKIKVEFMPGCFDGFEGTQEELDEMIAEINELVASGKIFENSIEITDENIDLVPDEIRDMLNEQNTPRKTLN